VFSDTEIFSNLELTQQVYDLLKGEQEELSFPLSDKRVKAEVESATNTLLARVVGRLPIVLRGDVLQRVIDETTALYRNPDDVKILLEEVDRAYTLNSK